MLNKLFKDDKCGFRKKFIKKFEAWEKEPGVKSNIPIFHQPSTSIADQTFSTTYQIIHLTNQSKTLACVSDAPIEYELEYTSSYRCCFVEYFYSFYNFYIFIKFHSITLFSILLSFLIHPSRGTHLAVVGGACALRESTELCRR